MPVSYSPTMEYRELLENNFTYHAPKPDQLPRYEAIRAKGKELAILLTENCPQSRELSLAIANLEPAIFWANASIARGEK